MHKALIVFGVLNALALFGSEYPGLSLVVLLPNFQDAQAAAVVAPAKIQKAIESFSDSEEMPVTNRLFDADEAFEKEEIVFEKPIAKPSKSG